ncbi:Photosystem I P700 chlorophyll a apoprotein A1 [Nymphaea thermarum]|nr:Photosystem I P700 chlorophyll a apoprotein A1 [Nymphaea thermarum]
MNIYGKTQFVCQGAPCLFSGSFFTPIQLGGALVMTRKRFERIIRVRLQVIHTIRYFLWYTTFVVHTSHVDRWIYHSWCCCTCSHFYDRVLRHQDAIISHLNWACLFLGFHSFGLYIHNDTMSALGHPQEWFSDTTIQLQPIFAPWIKNTNALAPGATAPGATTGTSLTWGCRRQSSFVTYSTGNRGFCGTSHSCIFDPCDCIDTTERCSICPQFSFDT